MLGGVYVEQEQMIAQILDFVEQHRESTASRAVYRRILGSQPEGMAGDTLTELRKRLDTADPNELEACYYLVK